MPQPTLGLWRKTESPTFKGPVDSSFLLSTFWPFIRANWIRPNFLPKHRVLRWINLQKQFKVLQASKQVSKNTSSFKINKMYTYGVTFASAEIPSMLILNWWIMIPCATFALKKYKVTVIWSQICPWSFYAANFNCRKSNNTIVDIIKAWPEYAFRYSYQVILLLLPVVETVVKNIKPDISKKIYIMAFRKDTNNRSNKNSFQRLAHCSLAILAVCCIESCETRVLFESSIELISWSEIRD